MSTPLRTLVEDLLHEPSARAAFAADPAGFLGGHGWGDLDGDDVATTVMVLGDELPIADAVRLTAVDAESFGTGNAGGVAGLQAIVAACCDGWLVDPAEGIDGGAGAAVDPEPGWGLDLDADVAESAAEPGSDHPDMADQPDDWTPAGEWDVPLDDELDDGLDDLDRTPLLDPPPVDDPPGWEEGLDHD